MTRKEIINYINLCLLVFGLCFMFATSSQELLLLGIGFFVTATLNLLFNNIIP